MKILITGGSGFVGSNLSKYLLSKKHKITAIGRSDHQSDVQHESYQYISADTTQPGKWQNELEAQDAVVNLTGTTIFKRWTASYKKQIYDSRILTTRNLVASLPEGKNIIFCSTSGAGYYGNRGEDILKEDEKPGNDFLAEVSVDWEKEASLAADYLALGPEETGRTVVRADPDRVLEVPVDDPWILADLDRPADYARMIAALR